MPKLAQVKCKLTKLLCNISDIGALFDGRQFPLLAVVYLDVPCRRQPGASI